MALKLIDDCLDPPDPAALRALTSNERTLAMLAAFASAFPDARIDVQWIAADTAWVAIGGLIRATHLGPWRGVAATGRPVAFAATLMFELEDARVVNLRTVTDSLAIAEQIGAVPALGPPACRRPQAEGASDERGSEYGAQR